VVGVAPPVTIFGVITPVPQSLAVQHCPHCPSGQQYGRPLSPPDVHSALEQHCRQPTPGQQVVPVPHAFW
jgi:hypothetical protein